MTANFSKCSKPAKIENPNPTGNSVHGTMDSVKVKSASEMGLTRTGDNTQKSKP